MADGRKVINYEDLWNEASTSSAAKTTSNGIGSHTKQRSSPTLSKVKNNGWSADGVPQTASSARKLRKILKKIEAGDLESAESELAKMGSAKNNYEVQRALAIAKTGRAGEEYDEEDDEEYDEEYDEYGDEDDEEDYEVDTEMTGGGFDWQGAMHTNGKEAGRQLTHAEIWDDSALVDAWNAAEEEYKLFHAQRSAHEQAKEQNGGKRSSIAGVDEGPPKKRSALWHDSPAKGSPIALAAKSAQEEKDRMSAELAERKKQAKALLAKVASEGNTQPAIDQGNAAPSVPPAVPVEAPTKKKLKGTTPPSSSIAGNLAWHSACATVSKTPNAIGAEVEKSEASIQQPAPAPLHAATSSSEGEDIFQNLAMAWYYAGYYQAMAMNHSNQKIGQ